MNLSELIAALQAQLAEHGDLPVTVENEYGEELVLTGDNERAVLTLEGGGASPAYIAINVESV